MSDLRQTFSIANPVGDKNQFVCFNIRDNNCRLITAVHFGSQIPFIHEVLTAPVKDVTHLMVIRNKSDLDRMIAWAWELSLLVEGGEDEPRDLLKKHGDSQSNMTDIAARRRSIRYSTANAD